MQTERRLKLRSRHGCTRCKRRRQKCGEQWPWCSRCLEDGASCVYATPRPDKRSKVPPSPIQPKLAISKLPCLFLGSNAFRHPSHSIYLDYFVQKASAAIACHDRIQQDTCHMIVSVATVYPCILYSALLFSAIHKTSAVEKIPSTDGWDIPLLELNALTLSMLRRELLEIHGDYKAIAAASLMLATAELRHNPDGPAWRMHFDSAKRLLRLAGTQDTDDALSRFIERRVALIQFLIALPTPWSGYRDSEPADFQHDDLYLEPIGVIDSTLACVQEISKAFEYIGQFSSLRREGGILGSSSRSVSYSEMALRLVVFVQQVMTRDELTPPELSDDIRRSCASSDVEEYRICNSIAQHMALLCIYRYGLGLSRDDLLVTESVDSIVGLANSMSRHKGSHPYLCLTTSLFIAGSEAKLEKAPQVKGLLETHYEVTKSQSTRKSIQMLDSLWSWRAAGHEFDAGKVKDAATFQPDQHLINYIPY